MADTSGLSDEQILADFYETPMELENAQSTSERHARIKQRRETIPSGEKHDAEEVVVEVCDSETDSSTDTETRQNKAEVSARPHVVQGFHRSQRPSSCRPLSQGEEQKSKGRSTASAPPIHGNPLQTIQKRPSTSTTFRRKLIRRDFKKINQFPSKRSSRRNSVPNSRHNQERNFPQASTTERASTAGPSLRISTEERVESVLEITDSSEEVPDSSQPSRIGSAKLAVRNRLANLIRAEMTTRGMKDDVRRNLFSPSFQILEATLFLGSLVFMVPFTVQIRSGEYALEGGIFRTIITGILLFGSILLHASSTIESVKHTTVQEVLSVTNSVDEATMLLSLLAFGFSLLLCRSRFGSLFDTFGNRFFLYSNRVNGQQWKVKVWTVLPFFLCMFIGNWTAWGQIAYLHGLEKTFKFYRNKKIFGFVLGNGNAAITAIHMFLHTYAHCVIMYTELLLWAASLSIYWMEKKKRAFCTQDNVEFDLNEATSLFRDLHEVINRRLSRPLGPILAMSCISLVTFNVSGLTTVCFGDWNWHIPIIMMIKFGHVLIAAEATANDENLMHQILTRRIKMPSIADNRNEDDATVRSNVIFQNELRQFKDAGREPMALKALDFANMNYALFGWVLVSAIGYFLVVAEWFKEEQSKGCQQ